METTEETICPGEPRLLAFHRGEAAYAEIDRIARHLSVCAACNARLESLETKADPLMAALRGCGESTDGSLATERAQEREFRHPDYEILERLGVGGMGVVDKALHRPLGRLVALKRLKADLLEDRGRFLREVELAAMLQHANVVQLHEIGEWSGQLFAAFELVAGGSLSDYLRGRAQPWNESAALVADLADAVDHAHRRGLLHRDIKSANVLLQPRDTVAAACSDPGSAPLSAFVPKLADFGIAKRIAGDPGATRTGAVLGTPAYMAPEQAEGKPIGPWADVYGLGAILYELLTGGPPFQGVGSFETMRRVIEDEPLPPSRLRQGLPRDLETICLTCLRKDPARRYATAAALGADLRRFLAGQPVVARPVSPGEAVWKWAQRRPGTAAALVAAQVALMLLAAGAWWYSGRLDAALRTTRAAELQAEENARLALEAHRQLVGRVQTLLSDAAGTRELRRTLLETAIDGLGRVAGAETSAPRAARAIAHQLMGEIRWELGEARQAIRELEASRRVAAELVATGRGPELDEARNCLAATCRRLSAYCLRINRPEEARRHAADAVEVAVTWQRASPDERRARQAVVEGYEQLAHATHWVRDLASARAALKRMHDLTRDWLEAEPGDLWATRKLSDYYDLMSGIEESEGNLDGALEHLDRALELDLASERASASGSLPESDERVRRVMVGLNNVAIGHLRRGDAAKARERMDAALERARQRAASDPGDVPRRLDLVDAIYTRSAIEQHLHEHMAAIPWLVECQTLLGELAEQGQLLDRPMYGVERREAVEVELETCRRLPAAMADESTAWSIGDDRLRYALAQARIEILLARREEAAALATAGRLLEGEPTDAWGWQLLARASSSFAASLEDRPAAAELRSNIIERGIAALERWLDLAEPAPTAEELRNDDRLASLRGGPGFDAVLAKTQAADRR